MAHLWLSITNDDIKTERLQATQEGRDWTALKFPEHSAAEEFAALATHDLETPALQARAQGFLDATSTAPMRADYGYVEPNSLEEILAQRPPPMAMEEPVGDVLERVNGAWVGRCCGCLLGKMVENWSRNRIMGFLKDSGKWPLTEYFSAAVPERILHKHEVDTTRAFFENVNGMPEDDDLNYSVTALAILEKYGSGFTPDNVAEFWLENIPILHTCTAERVAYRNLVNGISPPASAQYRNPYREWIGAQIRADVWGYVNPGYPGEAAAMAWRDACISHVKNGIYGEMWSAAMVATAFVNASTLEIVEAGLSQIPIKSRLAEAIGGLILQYREGADKEAALLGIYKRWDDANAHDWCHTISNAEIVALALLWGNGDFEESICMAVQAGFDTDCNGATVGSIIGAMVGVQAIPRKWKAPLNDTLETGVRGFHEVRISELAERTADLVGKSARGGA